MERGERLANRQALRSELNRRLLQTPSERQHKAYEAATMALSAGQSSLSEGSGVSTYLTTRDHDRRIQPRGCL